jgi:3-oxoadipate enol-lactonase
MPYAHVNDWKFYYEMTGSGDDIVFLHGENHGIEYFEYQIPEFSKTNRCLTYYRRGHGKTGVPSYGYSLTNQTRDLVSLLDYLRIEKPVIVAVAFSATIAINLALEYPQRVKGILMEGWSEVEGGDDYIEHFRRQTPVIVEVLKTKGHEGLVNYILKEGNRMFPVLPKRSPLREKYAKMFASRPLESYDKRMEFVTSVPNLIRRFHQVKVPVLGVDGANDPFPAHPNLLQGLPNFEEKLIPDTERFVHWEKPEIFNIILRGFLEKLQTTH